MIHYGVSYLLCPRHMGGGGGETVDKLTACINEQPNSHGWCLVENLPQHLVLENQELYFFS
jgi:hypothetical protein